MIRVVSKSSLNVIQLSLFHALSLPAAWWLNSTDSSLWPVETVIVCVSVCVSVHRVLTEEWSRHTHSTVRAGRLFFMFMHQFSTRKGVKCRGEGMVAMATDFGSLSLFISVCLSDYLSCQWGLWYRVWFMSWILLPWDVRKVSREIE